MMNQEELVEVCRFLSETPETVRLAAKYLTVEEQCFKPSETEFSILEHVCHLRDIEEHGYLVRIEKLLSESMPFLTDVDGNRLAIERKYQEKNLILELDAFTRYRAESLSRLGTISALDLANKGELEGFGQIKLSELLVRMRDHDEEHLQTLCHLADQISQKHCK